MFFLFIVLLSLASSDATYCSQSDDKTLYIYPSANNCSKFHACIDNEQYDFTCLTAPSFITWAAGPLCTEKCNETATTRKINSKISKDLPLDPLLYPNEPAPTIICPPTGNTIAVVMESCNEYMECSEGKGTKKSCDHGHEFSREKYKCVKAKDSECQKRKPQGWQHNRCRLDKGSVPIYMESDRCDEFKKCANHLAWAVPCARNCFWDSDKETCDWSGNVKCTLKDEKRKF